MGRFVKGDIVVVPFPFSDLTLSKRRPALVLADLAGCDVVTDQMFHLGRSPVHVRTREPVNNEFKA